MAKVLQYIGIRRTKRIGILYYDCVDQPRDWHCANVRVNIVIRRLSNNSRMNKDLKMAEILQSCAGRQMQCYMVPPCRASKYISRETQMCIRNREHFFIY